MSTIDRRSRQQRKRRDPVARYLGQQQADVMGVFWGRSDATVREVLEALRRTPPIAYTTLNTLVTRLYLRGLLKRERDGRGFRYRAAKSRQQFLDELSEGLIDQLIADFGAAGLARFDERLAELDPERRERLRRMRKAKK